MKVNKRTLHYYNDIGLFKPAYIDEKGYHYYSPLQAIDFDLVRTYMKIGMSLEEIMKYRAHQSDESFHEVLLERKTILDEKIRTLMAEKLLLERKTQKLELAMRARHGLVEEIDIPEQRILLSKPIEGKSDTICREIMEFSGRLEEIFGVYDNFGSRISIRNIEKRDWNAYDSFFAYVDDDVPGSISREGGHYLRGFSIGSWDKLEEVYQKMFDYAKKIGMEPVGYAYEEGLNEMSLERHENYVTMILLHVV